MLLHLYSHYAPDNSTTKKSAKFSDEERPLTNGHARIPDMADRQAHDAQEFELEGLMSDDEETKTPVNGRAH